MGFELVNGFIDHLYTRFGITHAAIADLHALQITRAQVNSSLSAFPSRLLVTDLNNRDSSATVVMPLPAG
jgi:hypothetical protein